MLELMGIDLELVGLGVAGAAVLGLVIWFVIARRGISPYALLGLAVAAVVGVIVSIFRRRNGLETRVEDATRRYEEGKRAIEEATEKAVEEAKAEVPRPPEPPTDRPLDATDVDAFLNRRGRKP